MPVSNEIGVKVLLLRESAHIPSYATEGSAGADLSCAAEAPITIPAGGRALIPTGISVECDRKNTAVLIFARSGLASKHGVCLANGVGVVDSDYRGEILVSMINLSDNDYTITPGERIAQMLFVPVMHAAFTSAIALGETERGSGGFGHTGKLSQS